MPINLLENFYLLKFHCSQPIPYLTFLHLWAGSLIKSYISFLTNKALLRLTETNKNYWAVCFYKFYHFKGVFKFIGCKSTHFHASGALRTGWYNFIILVQIYSQINLLYELCIKHKTWNSILDKFLIECYLTASLEK